MKWKHLRGEIEAHIEEKAQELIESGMPQREAWERARREFGNPTLIAESSREVWMWTWLDRLAQDLRYAFRAMRTSPGFTAVALLSLALGIGANVAIFNLWYRVLYSNLPGVRDPRELVMLTNPDSLGAWNGNMDGEQPYVSYTEFNLLRDRADSFSELAAVQSFLGGWRVRIGNSDWEEVNGHLVSGEFFEVLGVKPAIGRAFTRADEPVGAGPYAVISHNFWQRRFGGDAAVLGRTLSFRASALTIIGVTPPGFAGAVNAQEPDLWVPIGMQRTVAPGDDLLRDNPPAKWSWLHVIGRLKPGVTPAQAEAQSNTIYKTHLESFYSGVSQERRGEYLDQRLRLHSAARGISWARGAFSSSLAALLVAVGVLLLIACANLANLLLARGAGRKPEMAVRLSLGADRRRLVRQLMTESGVLAFMGGAAGLALAYFLHAGLVYLMRLSDSDFRMDLAVSPLLLAFTAATVIAAALLFGILPALQTTNTSAGAALKEQGRGATGSRNRMRWRRLLVSVQLALSLPLLVCAGLLAQTFRNLQRVDLGYPAEGLLQVRLDTRTAGYEPARRDALLRDLRNEFRALPGVRNMSFAHNGVFTGTDSGLTIEVEGYTPKGDNDRGAGYDLVGPDYFSTVGVPILMGREILETDTAAALKIAVINEAFARQFFEGRNPIGMHFSSVRGDQRVLHEIVGVAKDTRTLLVRGGVRPRYYIPATQAFDPTNVRANLLIRAAGEPGPILASVRRILQRRDATLPVLYARTVTEQIEPQIAQDRAMAQLAGVFALVALALATIGIYGVLSYSVARRSGEIAIRMALGAPSRRVLAMILRETTGVIAMGLVLGAALAYGATRLIQNQLLGVSASEPLTPALAIALLLAAALIAAYIPARRASRMDPSVSLRNNY
jgi:predicted permease